ncbi:MAG: CmcJ/NvfI family oxidoreductase [Sphingomonas sp.]
MLATTINGLFPASFKAGGRINLTQLMAVGGGKRISTQTVTVHDARPLQRTTESESAFLDEHGFVLVTAPPAVRDWDCDQSLPDNEISQLYLPLIEEIIRTRLLPGRKIELQHFGPVLRRGPGTANPNYATGAHQDYGLTVDDFQHDVAAFTSPEFGRKWRERYESDDVAGYTVLDFWRTAGMAGPLEHMPLALCDPNSVDPADIIETALQGIAPSGADTHHLSLRNNPGQRWYYYPHMTPDEVLVFKLFQAIREDTAPRLATCVHTAITDPTTPPGAAERQSCEHRVAVLLLRE